MRYNVTIQETLARKVQVEANSYIDAEKVVKKLYRDRKIILDSDDFVATEFLVNSEPSFYKSPNNDFTIIQDDCVET